MEILLEHLGRGFINMLVIAMPCVLTAAGIGLVVGILQAVTQVQEQTIAAAPKILGVFIVIMALGGFFVNRLTGYMRESANLAFNVITKNENYVLPADATLKSRYDDGKDYSHLKQPSADKLMQKAGSIPDSGKKHKRFSNSPSPSPNAGPDILEDKTLWENR